MSEEKMGNVTAIQKFFSKDPYGKRITMPEMKQLSLEERAELGALARIELGEADEEDMKFKN